jgi:hypothetical protein
MPNVCACGCGQELPETSTRQYKRGHKNKDINAMPDETFTESGMEFEIDREESAVYTIDDAARDTPNDPEPKEQPEPKIRATVRITAAMRRDVEGKLAFALGLGGQFWIMADPLCGSAFLDNTENIARKLTPVICQSPDIVRWLTKSSSFVLYVDLFMAFWPVVQMIFAHHIAQTVAVGTYPNGQTPAPNEYVVQ